MRFIYLFIICSFCSLTIQAQSLSISESRATSGLSTDQFLIAGHILNISNGIPGSFSIPVTGDVNALTAMSGTLSQESITIFSGSSSKLITESYTRDDDSSLKLYVKANGAFILRENIANFLFYGTDGRVKQSISNSSQSQDGESISELAADPAFKTVVLYNPKILRGGKEGSRARVVNQNYTTTNVFYNESRVIRFIKVSDDGQFLAIATYDDNSEDEVTITDRFGNELNTLSFDQNILDVNFTPDGRYLTIRSNGRAAVHSVITGERTGSTSFRSTLHFADYIPQDNMIIALTGDKTGSVINDVEVHAVNVSARSIDRQSYGESLGISDSIPVQLTRTAPNSYTLTGLSKILNLRYN